MDELYGGLAFIVVIVLLILGIVFCSSCNNRYTQKQLNLRHTQTIEATTDCVKYIVEGFKN